MKNAFLAIGLTLSIALAAHAAEPFPVFDGTLFANRPSDPLPGLRAIDVHGRFFAGSNYTVGDQAATVIAADDAHDRDALLCVDIENWPTAVSATVTDAQVEDSCDKLGQILAWAHDAQPGLRVGIYSILPQREYWAPVQFPNNLPAWYAKNERLAWGYADDGVTVEAEGLADKVDVVFPSLYTFYTDQAGWQTYAAANIAEARKYGKQVYVFLWMQYHPSNAILGWSFLAADYWRMQLEFAKAHADGIVIWGGWGANGRLDWDADAAWWSETVEFLAEN